MAYPAPATSTEAEQAWSRASPLLATPLRRWVKSPKDRELASDEGAVDMQDQDFSPEPIVRFPPLALVALGLVVVWLGVTTGRPGDRLSSVAEPALLAGAMVGMTRALAFFVERTQRLPAGNDVDIDLRDSRSDIIPVLGDLANGASPGPEVGSVADGAPAVGGGVHRVDAARGTGRKRKRHRGWWLAG